MSVHSIKNIGDTTPACKHLKDRHITIIKQKLGDSAYLKLNTRCIVFMVRENPTLFDTLMDGCTEEDQKLFFKRKDKYFCDKKEAFKDTNIFQDLKKFCKSHKQQKQISNLKSEIEAMKREKEARQAPLKGRKNTATAGPDASKASVIAVLAILTLFY